MPLMRLIRDRGLQSTLDFKGLQTSPTPAKPTLQQLIDYHHKHIVGSFGIGASGSKEKKVPHHTLLSAGIFDSDSPVREILLTAMPPAFCACVCTLLPSSQGYIYSSLATVSCFELKKRTSAPLFKY